MAKGNRADAIDVAKNRVAVVVIIVSILLSTIYGLISYFKGEPGDAFTAFSYGLILSLLFSCLGLLFDLIFSLNSLRIISQNLRNSADFETLMKLLSDSRKTMEAIHLSFSGDPEAAGKSLKLAKLPEGIIRDTGDRAFSAYLQDFRLIDDGIKTEGEAWAVKSYSYFWERLLAEQRKRRGNSDKPIVVRITHSNSINIWSDEHSDIINLMNLQKDFVSNGGRIARIFLGNEPEPNDKYKRVLAKMRSMNINAFYHQHESSINLPYDFLWVADLEVAVKWYSGAGGTSLGSCEILKVRESAARDLRNKWDSLWRQLADKSAGLQPDFNQEIENTFSTD